MKSIEEFGKAKQTWFAQFLALPHGIPSHDTFGRVFAALDPERFEQGFGVWMAAIAQHTAGQVVALDGRLAGLTTGALIAGWLLVTVHSIGLSMRLALR